MASAAKEAGTVSATADGSKNSAQFQAVFPQVIPFSFTLTETSIADTATSVADITVTGASLGDFVLLAPEVDVADVVITAQVTAANTVTIVIYNGTAAAATAFAGGKKVNGVVLVAGPYFDAPASY